MFLNSVSEQKPCHLEEFICRSSPYQFNNSVSQNMKYKKFLLLWDNLHNVAPFVSFMFLIATTTTVWCVPKLLKSFFFSSHNSSSPDLRNSNKRHWNSVVQSVHAMWERIVNGWVRCFLFPTEFPRAYTKGVIVFILSKVLKRSHDTIDFHYIFVIAVAVFPS